MKRIFENAVRKNISVARAAEVGVFYPATSNIIDFINTGVPSLLVEADPVCVKTINDFFKGKNITVYPVAVWDEEKTLTLYRAGASTYVSELTNTPAKTNDNYQEKAEDSFTVRSVKFSSIDPGDIDLISIDIEGAEWYVLKHMISRPKLINLELRADRYSNPHKKEIFDWLQTNGYTLWYHDDTDSVYCRNDVLSLSLFERVILVFQNRWVVVRHGLKRILKNLYTGAH